MKPTPICISTNPPTHYHRDEHGICITQKHTEPDQITMITLSRNASRGLGWTILEQAGDLKRPAPIVIGAKYLLAAAIGAILTYLYT